MKLSDAARDFLAQKRIAVIGVTRDPEEAANLVLRRLRDSDHLVFPVTADLAEAEGMRCYPDVASLPDAIDAAVVCTPAAESGAVVRACADRGITRVWLHRGMGTGSVSPEAVSVAQEKHLHLIPGACPAMFCEPVDLPHRCMRWILQLSGQLPAAAECGERAPGDRPPAPSRATDDSLIGLP